MRLTNLFTPKLGLLNKYKAKCRHNNRPMQRPNRIQTGIRETIGQGDRILSIQQ